MYAFGSWYINRTYSTTNYQSEWTQQFKNGQKWFWLSIANQKERIRNIIGLDTTIEIHSNHIIADSQAIWTDLASLGTWPPFHIFSFYISWPGHKAQLFLCWVPRFVYFCQSGYSLTARFSGSFVSWPLRSLIWSHHSFHCFHWLLIGFPYCYFKRTPAFLFFYGDICFQWQVCECTEADPPYGLHNTQSFWWPVSGCSGASFEP